MKVNLKKKDVTPHPLHTIVKAWPSPWISHIYLQNLFLCLILLRIFNQLAPDALLAR